MTELIVVQTVGELRAALNHLPDETPLMAMKEPRDERDDSFPWIRIISEHNAGDRLVEVY